MTPPRHVCGFFHADEDPDRVFIPYIREGLEHEQRVVDIVDPRIVTERERTLAAAGLPPPSTGDRRGARRDSTQLEVQGWDQSYLKDGYFDIERQLAFIESMIVRGKSQGYTLTRLVASMEWVLEPRPGVENLLEYEARLNGLMTKYDDAVVCSFDLSRFNASMIIDVLRVHPMVLLAGRVHLNPFFVPHNRMLAELRERRARTASS